MRLHEFEKGRAGEFATQRNQTKKEQQTEKTVIHFPSFLLKQNFGFMFMIQDAGKKVWGNQKLCL